MPRYEFDLDRKLSASELKKIEAEVERITEATEDDAPTEYPAQWLTASRDGGVV